jgi:hypothetical protein
MFRWGKKHSPTEEIMAQKQLNGTNSSIRQDQVHMYSPSIDVMMREVLHLLGDIDFKHEIELEKLEKSGVDQALRRSSEEKIRAAHRERREPYVELLATLRQRQHRLSFSA